MAGIQKTRELGSLRTKLQNLDKKGGGVAFDKASALTEARKLLGTDERFRVWLQDPAAGMGYTTGQVRACKRMIGALKKVPERALWERLGYYDGVSRLESIPKSNERAAVLAAVKAKRGVVTTSEFKALLAEKAPSLEIRDSVRADNEQAAKIKQLEQQVEQLKKWAKGSLTRYPFLNESVTDELRELLGVRRQPTS